MMLHLFIYSTYIVLICCSKHYFHATEAKIHIWSNVVSLVYILMQNANVLFLKIQQLAINDASCINKQFNLK